MAITLAVEDVGKDYVIPVIDRVSFTVEAGDFVCLLGPNGCGKTTLLRIVGGLEPVSRGRVTLDGEPIVHGPMAGCVMAGRREPSCKLLNTED